MLKAMVVALLCALPANIATQSAVPMECEPYDYERDVCCGGVWTLIGFKCTEGHKTCRYVRTCDPDVKSVSCGSCK